MSKLFNIHPLVVDKDIETALGLNKAIVLQQVHYWIEINKKHNRNCHKGINKLNFLTVKYAVNKFKEASKAIRIRNPIAYLKVCIYNSINEMAVDIDLDISILI